MVLTIEELAAVPRWSVERTLALAGRARGDTLGRWGENLPARFGANAFTRVRARLPAAHATIAPVLGVRDWVPVHAQLVVTEAIVDEFLGGDMLALYPLLVADTRAGLGRIQLAALRALGASGAFRLGPRTFRKVHERGTHEVTITGRCALLRFADNPLFEHPTWRVLQIFATRVMLELVGSPGSVAGEDATNGFTAIATW